MEIKLSRKETEDMITEILMATYGIDLKFLGWEDYMEPNGMIFETEVKEI